MKEAVKGTEREEVVNNKFKKKIIPLKISVYVYIYI